jgi:hypothetical protein
MALVRHVAFIQLFWNMTFHGLIEHGQSYSHTIFAHLMVNIYIPWVTLYSLCPKIEVILASREVSFFKL